jgi:hypothetical protein
MVKKDGVAGRNDPDFPTLFISKLTFSGGDDRHKDVALIAYQYLNDTAKTKIKTLLFHLA